MNVLLRNRSFSSKCVVFLFAVSAIVACKQSNAESATVNQIHNTELSAESTLEDSQTAGRKFIKTTDMKFQVNSVQKSTAVIEKTIKKAGGFVTKMELQSNVIDKISTKISLDSLAETTSFLVTNKMSLRIPNQNLDNVIDSITKQIQFLDSKTITQNDVSIRLLANALKQTREKSSQNRLEKAIDKKGKNLDKIILAENQVTNHKIEQDNAQLDNLDLEDQISFSTLDLDIYQRESFQNLIYPNPKNATSPHFGLQLLESVQTGWFLLEKIIAFLVSLWSFILLGTIIYFSYNYYKLNFK